MAKSRSGLFIVVAVAVAISSFIPLRGAEAASGKVIKIKMVGTLPIGHHLTTALDIYKKYVEEKSNGRVVVELYPAQQLYNDKDLVSVLPKGSVDMAIANMDMWTGLVPSVGFFYMPLIFQSEDHFFRVAHGKAGEILQEELQKNRCLSLGWIHYGTSDFIFKSPVAKLEDLKGKRVRSYGQMISYFQQSLGIAPVMMSSGEMYDALQKGTIDGAQSGLTSFNSRKLYETAKNVPDTMIAPVVPFMTLVNLKFYRGLPKDIQKILSDGAVEIEKYSRKAANEDTLKSRKVLEKNGVKFEKIPDAELARWREKAVPFMMAKYKENYDSKKVEVMFKALGEGKDPVKTGNKSKKRK